MATAAGRNNFSVQGRDIAAYFTGDSAQVYPRVNGWTATKPIVEERQWIAMSSISANPGSSSFFEIGRPCDGSREWYVEFDRAAGTYTQSSGGLTGGPPATTLAGTVYTPPWSEDWELYSAIDYYTVSYNNKFVFIRKGEQLLHDVMNGLYCTENERTELAKMQNGFLSIEERQARFARAQNKIKGPLQVPWRKITKSFIHIATPNKVRIDIYWLPDNKCIHQPLSTGTVSGVRSNVNLVLDGYHMLEEDRGNLYFDIYGGSVPYKLKTMDIEYEWNAPFTAAVGTQNTDAKFTLISRNLKNNCIFLRAVLRYQDNVDNPQCLDRQKELPIRTLVLEDQGRQVTVSFSGLGASPYNNSQSFMLSTENTKAFPHAHPGSLLYYIKFCPPEFVMHSEDNCFGSRTISKYTNPGFTITYNASFNTVNPFTDVSAVQIPSTSMTLTRMYFSLWSYCHQIIVMAQSDFRRILNI